MTLSKEELEKRVSVLERKALREKKARQLAENQLEKYSLDIYEANQSLKGALADSKQKQLELEYLARTSSDVASEIPLNDMISNIVMLTGEFCSASYGLLIISENGQDLSDKNKKVWSLEQGWQENSKAKELAVSLLPLCESTIMDSWLVSLVDNSELDQNRPINSIFYTNFAWSGSKVGWLAFLSEDEGIAEDFLPVLNTSKEHLVSGIRRRLTDIRILKRNVQLQDSLSKLEKARRQLIQSEKMASLGQLAAGVAHEINNPIAFIRSNLEVLQDYLNDYKQLNTQMQASFEKNKTLDISRFEDICKKVDLDYIEEDSEDLLQSNIEGLDRVKEIVDNLKGFSHSGDEALVETSLNDCIQSALKIAGNMFKYQHKIDNHMSTDCPLILGNSGQLQQVFVNLFVNAAHAMEDGGLLTIDYTKINDAVVIRIKDTGSGMDEETVNQLFTPFFTTKPVGVGTGLGLSVSYAILEAHGAQVTVDSELNVGTTFNITFPVIN
ncbi:MULTISPECIES: sensor histidine kinase [Aliiglaciecola]|uniref:sensor histidine kinase n=1 Tax=Aliiglaciecola TaxID=1406885 RepID=UPI001C09D5E7|nr:MULTISPECIES: ATP-binding protein [Aliiglaciecola]MBU2879203.1 two-component sensor histidine kinase [Aliiglaciecola lipolytica]MDO6712905.1 ATP-binding protein [Aliiglaciecola sp. 2_MG-2023]MDO6752859.1 ATP-binding protein [Aliiglaciecola sp. 1_MG-2023]